MIRAHRCRAKPGTQAGKPGLRPVVPLLQIKITKCLKGNALQKKDTQVTPKWHPGNRSY